VQHPIGLGARKKQVDQSVLIPGLKLKFEGTGDQNQVTAESITFDQDDLSVAKVIQAGLNPVAQQQSQNMQTYQANKTATDAEIAANQAANQAAIAAAKQEIAANQASIDEVAQSTQKRFSELGDFVVKGEHTVYFATGSYSISGEDRNALADLAKKSATYEKGYVIQVAAFADSVGTASSNQLLSKERAQAVVAYLLQECSVPVGRIVAPGAMGETNPAASNESPSGRGENRRAEVKLLVNKGLVGTGGN
jgi:outer membrane protein OmpA-like peptidoglycan-associated protein